MKVVRIIFSLLRLAAVLALLAEPACAQCGGPEKLLRWNYYGSASDEEPSEPGSIETDRPDFTESALTVGYGVVQLETGYTFTYDKDSNSSNRNHSFPESLLRIGMLAEWFELRIDWNYVENRENVFGDGIDTVAGGEDLGIGCKIALTAQEYLLPEAGLILQMSVPTGAQELTANQVLPGINYIYEWQVTEKFSTGGQSQFNLAVDDETSRTYTEFSQSWTTGYDWTDAFSHYAEWYMFAPAGADTNHNQQYFNGGFKYLLNDNLQWDIRAGLGLNDAADDYFIGSGVSFRWL